MATKSKGINRLSVACGLILVFASDVYILLFVLETLRVSTLEWIVVFLVLSFVAYFLGWGTVRVIYWIYSGFKEDSKKEGGAK